MNKFKVGDIVVPLVARGVAKEGDIGKVESIHPENASYRVGFYVTEDACIGSYLYFEDELRASSEDIQGSPFQIGDLVMTKKAILDFKEGEKGEIIDVYLNTKGAAVKIVGTSYILPFGFDDLVLLKSHHED